TTMSDSEPINEAPVKRGRGRPRKDPSSAPAKKSDSVSNGAPKGKRGRKPGSTNKPKTKAKPANSETGAKRGRGRPRKSETEKAPKSKKAKKAAESSESEQQDNSSLEEEE